MLRCSTEAFSHFVSKNWTLSIVSWILCSRPAFFFSKSTIILELKAVSSMPKSRQTPGVHISRRSEHSPSAIACASCLRAFCKSFPCWDVANGVRVLRKRRFKRFKTSLPWSVNEMARLAFLVNLRRRSGQNRVQVFCAHKCIHTIQPYREHEWALVDNIQKTTTGNIIMMVTLAWNRPDCIDNGRGICRGVNDK